MLQNILYLWYNYEKTKINSTLQVLSLLILQATVHTASRQTMMCSSDESQLIRLLMQLLKAKKVIEIGKIHKCVSLCLYKGYQGVHQILYLFIYLFTNFAKMPGWVTEQAPLQGPEKENNTNTYNNDNVLETTETAITNRIGANVGQRINNTKCGPYFVP